MTIQSHQFREKLTYDQTDSVTIILTDLQKISETIIAAKAKQDNYNQKGTYYILGFIVAITLAMLLPNMFNISAVNIIINLLIISSIYLLCTSIYVFFKANEYKKLSKNNYRIQLTQQGLQMFARDMDIMTKVEVYLNLKNLEEKENKFSTVSHPYKPNWKIDNYQLRWLKIKGEFLDKTHFDLTATQLSKTQYGWKRSRSGKSKYKSKTKPLGLDIGVTLIYPQYRYGAVKILKEEINGALKLPYFAQLKALKLTDKAIRLVVRVSPEMVDKPGELYKTITMIFLSLYQVLNLAKILSKPIST
ncbi:hypothetical protein QUB80_27390 [Chlorogloeopsis sp. ULAP01]|uniref:hypothetical protein n=1 Tax=Chlorogloeopsis sp. ULAP01 TaxID=3056483 RepID=UPI0025AA6417|nr:hypothetical protein [Chlorogloeopsis sp. ULAP01]MDM9384400.1 hypothetical protein [Chlorogloeopsis sp. ULAP01]